VKFSAIGDTIKLYALTRDANAGISIQDEGAGIRLKSWKRFSNLLRGVRIKLRAARKAPG
jgi:signal transduction histidine kinase